jgi:hypothetical protein
MDLIRLIIGLFVSLTCAEDKFVPKLAMRESHESGARAVYSVSTAIEIREAVNTAPDHATILVCADIVLQEALQLTNKHDIMFDSRPGERYVLSGGGRCQIMIVQGNTSVVIQNLTLANGNSSGLRGIDYGGAVSVVGDAASLDAFGSVFHSNKASFGGAVACREGSACSFNSVAFFNCTAVYGGGGVLLSQTSQAIITGSTFTACIIIGDNLLYNGGGAIFLHESYATIVASTFTACYAPYGGAVLLWRRSRALIIHNTYTNCSARTGGGGLMMFMECKAIISHCAFKLCTSKWGGAMMTFVRSQVDVSNSLFASCAASQNGGAIYLLDGRDGGIHGQKRESQLTLRNSSFTACMAHFGGAVMLWAGEATILDSIFTSCSTTNYGKLYDLGTGGAVVLYGQSNMTMMGTSFLLCSASYGGAVLLWENSVANISYTNFVSCNASDSGGAVVVGEGSRTTISDASFTGCTSEFGGALSQATQSTSTFIRTQFHSNSVQSYRLFDGIDNVGGTIWSQDSDLTFFWCGFMHSNAPESGGAIFSIGKGKLTMSNSRFTNVTAGVDGAAIYRLSHAPIDDILELTGCSFVNCSASKGSGGAAYVSGAVAIIVANSSFRGCTSGTSGGAISILSTASATQSSFVQSRFMDSTAGERGGALYLRENVRYNINECKFLRCRVKAAIMTEQCLQLTMRTLEPNSQWAGALLFLVKSEDLDKVSDLVPQDFDCTSPNKFCSGAVRSKCKCQCLSRAEESLASIAIANFTMKCQGGGDQQKTICLDAATQGSSFAIFVTAGADPITVQWSLGTAMDPTTYISDGQANQIRYSIEPFSDTRSAANGYGGGRPVNFFQKYMPPLSMGQKSLTRYLTRSFHHVDFNLTLLLHISRCDLYK